MFPHLPTDVILFELNENKRELERTITALLAYGSGSGGSGGGSGGGSLDDATYESDEAVARRLQDELDSAAARNLVGSASRSSFPSSSFLSSSSRLDEAEMDRLRLAQFAHREAIYQTNAEGEVRLLLYTKHRNWDCFCETNVTRHAID
jgi:hypothetical protein